MNQSLPILSNWLISVLALAACGTATLAAEIVIGATNQTLTNIAVNYPQWQTLLDEPLQVSRQFSLFDCRAPQPHITASPHFVPSIQIYANPTAWGGFSATSPTQMLVGSLIVKEKLDGTTNRVGYAVMLKREPGFGPVHGDWEYAYYDGVLSRWTALGAVASCRDCHNNARETDHLFRAYGRLAWLRANTNGPVQLPSVTLRPPK